MATEPLEVEEGPTYQCAKCRVRYVSAELKRITAGNDTLVACPRCGRAVFRDKATMRAARPLRDLLGQAFVIPRGSPWLRTLATLALAKYLFDTVPVVSLATTVLAAYGFAVIQKTARGDDEPPFPGDFTDSFDMMGWVLRFYLTVAVAMLPVFVLATYGPGGPMAGYYTAAAMAASLFYLPAGLIVIAYNPWYWALNPVPAVRLIARIPGPYAALAGTFVLACGVQWMLTGLAGALLRALEPVPYLPRLVTSFALLYIPLGLCRAFGLVLCEHRDEIGMV